MTAQLEIDVQYALFEGKLQERLTNTLPVGTVAIDARLVYLKGQMKGTEISHHIERGSAKDLENVDMLQKTSKAVPKRKSMTQSAGLSCEGTGTCSPLRAAA